MLVNHGNPERMTRALREKAAATEKFVLVETGGNHGFARGCNIGVERARGDLVLFLNPDAVLATGVASRLKQSADGLPGDAPWIIGARIVNPDGSEQRGGRRGELTPASAMVGFLGLDRFVPGMKSLHYERDPLTDTLMPVPVVSGAALLMPRAGFRELGGFDERYFLHVEDIDICRRVREAGGSVWFEPRADIVHFGGTSRTSPTFVETQKGLGFIKYFWKFYTGPLERLTTMAMIVPIFAALWGRVAFLKLRRGVRNRRHRNRALRRLKRLRAHRASR